MVRLKRKLPTRLRAVRQNGAGTGRVAPARPAQAGWRSARRHVVPYVPYVPAVKAHKENRMTVHQSGGTTSSYTYDAMSRKRSEIIAGTATTLVWDGWDYLQSRAAAKINLYTVGGSILAQETVGGARWDYLTDALGSVVATQDSTTAVGNTYRYKPYGAQLAKTGTSADPAYGWVGSLGYRPTGRVYSEEYVRARHFGSTQARWTSRDPLWPGQLGYGYVGAMPTMGLDPHGSYRMSPGASFWQCMNSGGSCAFCKARSGAHVDCGSPSFPQPAPLPRSPISPTPWQPPPWAPLPPTVPGVGIPCAFPGVPNPPGSNPVKGLCISACQLSLCVGKFAWVVCGILCDKLCDAQTDVHTKAEQCWHPEIRDCAACCTKYLPSAWAQGMCIQNCGDLGTGERPEPGYTPLATAPVR